MPTLGRAMSGCVFFTSANYSSLDRVVVMSHRVRTLSLLAEEGSFR